MPRALVQLDGPTHHRRLRKRLLALLTSFSMVGILVLVTPVSPSVAAVTAHLAFTEQPSSTTAGSAMAPAVTVSVLDENDDVVDTDSFFVTLAIGSDPSGGAASLSGGGQVQVEHGVATFEALAIDKAADGYTLTATDTSGGDLPATSATSAGFNIAPGEPDHLAFDVQPSDSRAGDTIPVVKVGIYDQFDNLTHSSATVSLDIDGPTPPALFPDQPASADALDGTASFDDLSIHRTGAYFLAASSGELGGATSTGFDISPAAIDHFDVSAPGSTGAGDSFDVTVTAYDEFDNVKTDYDGTIEFTSSDQDPFPADLPADYQFTVGEGADNGAHTFSGAVTLFNTPSQSVTVTDSVDGNATGSANVDVTPAALDHFELAAPGSTVAGDPFDVTVTAYDEFGNVKTDYVGSVRLTSSDGNPFPADLPEDYQFTAGEGADNGVHTFADGVTLFNTTSQSVTVADTVDVTKTATVDVDVAPAALDHFVWGSIGALQTAGSGFSVTVTAYDAYGNVKTNYTGAGAKLSTNMGNSPNGSQPTVNGSPFSPSSNLTWGSGTGVGTATIVPKNATKTDTVAGQTQNVTITSSASDGSVSAMSGSYAVSPIGVATLTFTGQPIDTQVATPIYSLCAPATATPCALTTAAVPSSPVAVYAVDTFGNPVLALGVRVSGGVDVAITRTTNNGTATYGNDLKLSTLTTGSGTTLLATAVDPAVNPAVTRTSGNFRVVDALKGCQGQSCVNKALGKVASKTYVNAWSQITTSGSFFTTGTNVLQSTQLVATEKSSKCGTTGSNLTWVSDAVDQRVTGSNTQVTTGGLGLIVIPKSTLKSSGVLSRGTPSFNVCFGAIWIGSGSPSATQGWLGKTSASNNTLVRATQVADATVVPQGFRFYGIPADCGTRGLTASDPCILLRTKKKSDIQSVLGADAASIMTDSDVGIIVRVAGAWDGRSHPF